MQEYTDWDFIKDNWRWFKEGFRLWELLANIIIWVSNWCIFGWAWGTIFASFIFVMLEMGHCPFIDYPVYPKEEYPPNECSAGIENCNICNNEYEHGFNEKYGGNPF